MKVYGDVLNEAVDVVFDIGIQEEGFWYRMKLLYSVGESDPETITFKEAGDGALANGVTELTASVFFAVSSGKTVQGLQVYNSDDEILIEENVPDEEFTANGTFTVNNIVVTIADE